MKHLSLLLLLIACLIAVTLTAQAQPNYSGVAVCQGCHSSTSIGGDQYPRWLTTAHAKAFDSIAVIQTNPACLPCHTTGWDTLKANGGFDDYFVSGDQSGKDRTKNDSARPATAPLRSA